jgi:hypothetical protein
MTNGPSSPRDESVGSSDRTGVERRINDEAPMAEAWRDSDFVISHSFDIRHSGFVITFIYPET